MQQKKCQEESDLCYNNVMKAIGVATAAINRLETIETFDKSEFLGIMRSLVKSFKELPLDAQRDPEIRRRAENISRTYTALKSRARYG